MWSSVNGIRTNSSEVISSGFSDPMTTRGDVIYKDASNVTARLPIGTNGQVITSDGTDLSWSTPSAGSGSLTTKGDLEVYTTSQTRLAVGTNDYVLTADSTEDSGLAWKAAASGFSDPMTTRGDIIFRNDSATTRLALGTDGQVLTSDGTDAEWGGQLEAIQLAVSDEDTDLTTGTAKLTFRMPFAMTLFTGSDGVRASLSTAPVGSVLTVDINEGGTTILSTKLTIDASEKTSTTAATAVVVSDVNLADDAEITIDIDGIGSSTAGAGLKVTLLGRRA